jgi:PadR family transcriptional regulator AphA
MSPLARLPLTIEHALLGYLRHGPLHGYELHRRLAEGDGLGQVWRLKQGHLYALLARLETEGCVASRVLPQDSRPARREYTLTAAGRERYQAWIQQPVARGREFRLEFLAKLYFARQEPPPTLERLLAAQRAALEEWRGQLQARAADLPQHSYERLVEHYRLGQLGAMLAWLDECARAESAAGAT